MAVLDSLLRFKAMETQQKQQDVQALGSALGTFIQSKNAAQDRALDQEFRRAQINNINSQIQQRGVVDQNAALKENLQIQNLAATVRQKNMLEQMLGPQIEGGGGEIDKVTLGGVTIDKQTAAEKFKVATDLRKEFKGLPEVQDFTTIRENASVMDSLLESARSGELETKTAVDNALIKLFEKITDPTSVVRESEFARTPEGIPIIRRLPALINKLFEGGAGLTNEDREELVKAAKVIANEKGKSFNKNIERFQSLSKEGRINEDAVLGGIERFEPFPIGVEDQDNLMNKAFEGL